jgi:hypothetical protein
MRLTKEMKDYFRRIGKAGGLNGGPARARALSPTRRREIASKAALARWKK